MRAKLTTCFGGLGIRVAQMGFLAHATYQSAVDLHKAVMTSCLRGAEQTGTRDARPEEVTAVLAAKIDLLFSAGSLLTNTPRVMVEHKMPASCTRQARGRRTSERRRLSARPMYRRQTGSRQKAWHGTWRSPSYNRSSCRLRRRCRLRKLHSGDMLPEQQAIMLSAGGTAYTHVLDGSAQTLVTRSERVL